MRISSARALLDRGDRRPTTIGRAAPTQAKVNARDLIEKIPLASKDFLAIAPRGQPAQEAVERRHVARQGDAHELFGVGARDAREHIVRNSEFGADCELLIETFALRRRGGPHDRADRRERHDNAPHATPHDARLLSKADNKTATKPPPETVAGSAIHARYPLIAPLVEAVLPAHDAAPISARDVFAIVRLSTIGTTRAILAGIAREGRASVSADSFRQTGIINRYRRATPEEAAP